MVGGNDAVQSEPLTVLVLGKDLTAARFVQETLQGRKSDVSDGSSRKLAETVDLRRAKTLQDGIDEWDETVDVVMTELDLPDSAGIEIVDTLANAVRRRDGNEAPSAPIVVLARPGTDGDVSAVETIEHGAQEYVEMDSADPNPFRRRIQCAVERYGTERALRRRNQELIDLISVVGHDIRNDIAVVEGWSGVLRDHVDSTGRDELDRIENASQNVLRIVETTTDLLGVLDSQRETERRPINVVGVARTEVETARTAFEVAEIRLVENVPEDETVEATERLSAVFRALLANGLRYNDNSTPVVTMELTDGPTSVTVEVADNGSGIPSDRREEVFGRGERGLESPEARLSLYLVDTLVGEYGGTVEVTDTESAGTTIEVTLRKATSASRS